MDDEKSQVENALGDDIISKKTEEEAEAEET